LCLTKHPFGRTDLPPEAAMGFSLAVKNNH
jgi:hypothetical protein